MADLAEILRQGTLFRDPDSSEFNARMATIQQPQMAAQAPLAPQPTPQSDPQTMLGVAIQQAIRGNQQYAPGGFRRTGYQVAQQIAGPMPGTDTEVVPTMVGSAGGQYGIDPTVYDSLSPEAKVELLVRNARAYSEPVDVTGLGAQTPYERASSAAGEAQGQMVMTASGAQDQLADLLEQRAARLRTQSDSLGSPGTDQRAAGLIAALGRGEDGGPLRAIGRALGAGGYSLTGANPVGQFEEIDQRERDALRRELLHRSQINQASQQLAMQLAGLADDYEAKAIQAREGSDQIINQRNLDTETGKLAKLTGTHSTIYQDVPGRVVGQAGGVEGLARLGKTIGLSGEQLARFVSETMRNGSESGSQYTSTLGGPKADRASIEAARFDIQRRVFLPPEAGSSQPIAWASNPETAKEVTERVGTWRETRFMLGRLQQLLDKGSTLSPSDREEANIIATSLMAPKRVEMGLGVMSESDKELVKPLTGGFVTQMTAFDKRRIMGRLFDMSNHAMQTNLKKLAKDPGYSQPLYEAIDAKPVK